MEPVFIISLPRSGSTLLQRILAGHTEVSTTSEPWIVLPMIYSLKDYGVLAEYSQNNCSKGINDFINNLEGKEVTYFAEVERFIKNLYSSQNGSREKRYFLDKTPRYHLIIDELYKIFPNGKYIFLIRNPGQIISSIIKTYFDGRLYGLYTHSIDFEKGFDNLMSGIESHQENSIVVHYEDLVSNTKLEVERICSYLQIDFRESLVSDFSNINFSGRLGDPGYENKSSIFGDSLNFWVKEVSNPIRKSVYRAIIEKIPENSPFFLKMDKKTTLTQIQKQPNREFHLIPRDIIDMIYNKAYLKFRPQLFFGKSISKWSKRLNLS